MKKIRKMKTVFTYFSVMFFLIFGVSIILLVNLYMKKQALLEAESKALIIADMSMSIHQYFAHDLKPELFKITDAIYPESYFEPSWMSSTYAIRGINNYFSYHNSMGYYYKECAINARSAENEADEYERKFITETNDTEIESRTGIREINGIRYLDILRKGEIMEAGCLRCHSGPSKAPAGLIKKYGKERSFQRREGEVISAISIRIPLEEAYGNANYMSVMLSGVLMLILAGYAGVSYYLYNSLIFFPLALLREKAVHISRDRNALGKIIESGGASEIVELTGAFNEMSLQLAGSINGLEQKLQQRTAEINEANVQLKRSLDEKELLLKEVHHRIKNNISMTASLLMLQAQTVESSEASEALEEAHNRLLNMMRLYDRLYVKSDYKSTMTADYIPGLIEDIRETFGEKDRIILHKHIENFETDSRTLFPLSIIIYELVTNAFKYGFNENKEGEIHVSVKKAGEKTAEIKVEDNGVGLPEGFKIEELKSFGLYLVRGLAEQRGGRLEAGSGKGACFKATLCL